MFPAFDCGVFVILFVDKYAASNNIVITQSEVDIYRKVLFWIFLNLEMNGNDMLDKYVSTTSYKVILTTPFQTGSQDMFVGHLVQYLNCEPQEEVSVTSINSIYTKKEKSFTYMNSLRDK